jgi:hypothetical protein
LERFVFRRYPKSKLGVAIDDAQHVMDKTAVKMGLGMLGGLIIGIASGVVVRVHGIWPGDPFLFERILILCGVGLLCAYLWGLFAERQAILQSRFAVRAVLAGPPVFWLMILAVATTGVVNDQMATTDMLKDVSMIAHASNLQISISQTRESKRSASFIPQDRISWFRAALLRSEGSNPSHLVPIHEGTITISLNGCLPIEWYWCVPENRRTSLLLANSDAYILIDDGWQPLRQMLDR